MAVSADFHDYIVDLLVPFGPVQSKRMFGGYGLYLDGTIFAVLSADTLFLKVDDLNRSLFEDEDMSPFNPSKDGKRPVRSYFECPPHLLEDTDELCAWAKRSWEAARRLDLIKPKKKKQS